jgi:hypothetical protein
VSSITGGYNSSGGNLSIPADGTPTDLYNANGTLIGNISISSDGNYTFNPEPGFVGEVPPLTYDLEDPDGNTDEAVLQVIVHPDITGETNNTYSNDDVNSGSMDEILNGNVLDNDTDPEGDTQTVTGIDPQNDGTFESPGTSVVIQDANGEDAGTLMMNSDGTYTWTPEPEFYGSISVPYAISDGNGATSQSTLYLTNEPTLTILPIELLNFGVQAVNLDAEINWSTVGEVNNSHFELQRSLNGSEFKTIAHIEGAGTTNQEQQYQYTDAHAGKFSDVFYYRLKQIDVDGHFEYTHVVSVHFESLRNRVNIYPNPAENVLYIRKSADLECHVHIVNMHGQLMGKYTDESAIDISNYAAGVYYVNITDDTGNTIRNEKVIFLD